MRLSNIALAITAIYGAFSPADLFANGEQGAWYDPSDYSTLFTDSAGTTPVTGVEQFVGLMLDKSQGLVTIEVAPNSGTSLTGWGVVTTGGGSVTSTASGIQLVTDGSGTQIAAISCGGTAGIFYKITATVEVVTGVLVLQTGVNVQSFGVGTTTFTTILYSTTGQTQFKRAAPTVATTAYVRNISVRELPGNHAFQTSSAKRPKLAARYNLLTYSEEFDNGAWIKGATQAIDVNATTAPNGTTTADLIKDNNAGGTGSVVVWQNVTLSANTSYTFLVHLKDASRTQYAAIRTFSFDASANGYTYVNLANGSIVSSDPAHTAGTPIDVGDGCYQFSITVTLGADNTGAFAVYASQNGTNTTVDLDNTSGFYIWGADLRPASQATGAIGPTYQRVAAAGVYDTAGFLPYLAFDGLDDSMSTNSIDFSAGDKVTVWAGVRKLSTSLGIIAETSANADTNAGVMSVATDVFSASEWFAKIVGSGGGGGYQSKQTGFASPVSSVLAISGNINGSLLADKITLRVNAVASTDRTTASVGTGNFGNYPLYIGMRNNASLPFTGWLTSLIVRGAQSTQSQIEATEAWVNQKTGAF